MKAAHSAVKSLTHKEKLNLVILAPRLKVKSIVARPPASDQFLLLKRKHYFMLEFKKEVDSKLKWILVKDYYGSWQVNCLLIWNPACNCKNLFSVHTLANCQESLSQIEVKKSHLKISDETNKDITVNLRGRDSPVFQLVVSTLVRFLSQVWIVIFQTLHANHTL